MAYPPISTLPTPPSRQDPTNFSTQADAFLGALPTFQTQVNAAGDYIETKAVSVGNTFIGNYSAVTTYVIGQSVLYTNGIFYISLVDSNIGNTPTTNPTKWSAIPSYSLSSITGNVGITGNLSVTGTTDLIGNLNATGTTDFNGNVIFSNAIIETVFALTGTTPALNPNNGTIQTWTLSANSTPTDSFIAGQAMTLMIDDGAAYSITWPSVTWKSGGVAPILETTGFTVVTLWKVGTTLYGARVGGV